MITATQEEIHAIYTALRIAEKYILGMDDSTKEETKQAIFSGLNAFNGARSL